MRDKDRDAGFLGGLELRLEEARIRRSVQHDDVGLRRDGGIHALHPLRRLTLVRVDGELHADLVGDVLHRRFDALVERVRDQRNEEHALAFEARDVDRRSWSLEGRKLLVLLDHRADFGGNLGGGTARRLRSVAARALAATGRQEQCAGTRDGCPSARPASAR